MNVYPLIGIVLIAYALLVLYIAFARPVKIWDMSKIKLFRKYLTDKGTIAFFLIWALGFIGLGVWMFFL